MARDKSPRHFYLNEQHELTREVREAGGSLPKLAPINWAAKQRVLTRSLAHTRETIERSQDPLRNHRYFLLAKPERAVKKLSIDRKKAPGGEFEEPVDYAGRDAKVLGRLGLDVLSVMELGAIVHATPEKFQRLETISANLEDIGPLEQARWAPVAGFDAVPEELRADRQWLETLADGREHEAVIELQPILTRTEGGTVLSTIANRLSRQQREAIIGSGEDFSGRSWVRARLTIRTIREIIRNYFSVQSVHQPLLSSFIQIAGGDAQLAGPTSGPVAVAAGMPAIAIVDGGIPSGHRQLEGFRRGTVIDPDSFGVLGDHGTFVASRAVFGDPPDPVSEPPSGSCEFLDVIVSRDAKTAEDKIVSRAVNFAAANYPDVRTFNLSLGDYTAWIQHPPVERNERLLLTQDLDNVVFARDIVVVVAAGNSLPNTVPSIPYPAHWQDAAWSLGHWALGFNTLTCGSFVKDWSLLGGVATIPYSPSPFCRVGPGLAGTPVPDLSAHGGNCNQNYGWTAGLGVQGLSNAGLWEDRIGTSFAAPILAREVAFGFQALRPFCPPGVQPFGATIKALLALTALPIYFEAPLDELSTRTLGHGEATSRGILQASNNAAVFIWQGIMNDKSDVVKVMLPIPVDWLRASVDPACDLAVAWDTPVNAAFPNVYGCRRVDAKLRTLAGGKAARPLGGAHPFYPLRIRTHPLKRLFEREKVNDDLWVIELNYEEICDYPATQAFAPEQRVGVALRLYDRAGRVSPQDFVQLHSLASTMTRLSAVAIPTHVPVTVKST